MRADMNLQGHALLPGSTVSVPVHMLASSSGRSRRCPHHQRHHHHHHHHPQGGSGAQQHHHFNQDKLIAMGYNVAPYPCRYRLPSSELLPNHDELVAAGAIPASPQPMVLSSPPPAPPTPTPPAPPTGKQRKPRSARGR